MKGKKSSPAPELIPASELRQWAVRCLRAVKVPTKDAQLIARSLVHTSLWGIDSHGIARLGHYLARFTAGSIEARPRLRG
jgi:ureidoglycolate dehydrogenase (NAD+)